MKRKNVRESYYLGALLYVFLVSFPEKLVTLSLIVWVLLSLLSFRKEMLLKNKYLLLLPAFYVLYFVGFFTSENPSFKFLEHKLSFLIFPLIFFLHQYSEKQRKRMLQVFVLGLVGSALVCLGVACFNSIVFQDGIIHFKPNVLEGKGFMESILYGGNYFFGRYLSIFHQTVYYASYLCAGIAILLFNPKLFPSKTRFVILGLFVLFVFLISNKASFIVLTLLLCIRVFTWQSNKVKKTISFSVFAIIVASFIIMNPRIRESLTKVADGELLLNKEARYGFSTRLLSWDAAISLIKEKPILGYGYANTQLVLNKRYEQKGYTYPLMEKYNAHNLWLQSWLENGILAILILISIFYFLLKQQLPGFRYSPLLLTFVLILLVNSMFEGMFNRFSGISFFSFLVCFIFSALKGGLSKK
ncbi:O-antigen ligase family protein [Allomuricauda sp. R78024]|uniref:O-antigen ligase family protein n=1 Tax=Allomuricauda sp. R78024 TaxID=3093867 RepID=UPI0037CA671D